MTIRLRFWLPVVVLGLFFSLSFWQVISRRVEHAAPDQITIRLGHWLLQAGMREAFDEAAADYHKLHPHVTVEQVAVPIRMWNTWLRTQLIGGTPPDIMGLNGTNEELLNRYYVPLTAELIQPNPYNAGTPLDGVLWRDTFVDGLNSMRERTATTGEISGVYLHLNTLRLFYNKPLLKLVTGSDQSPSDYAGLRALKEQVDRYNTTHNLRLVPIAGCGPYAEYLFNHLLPSQTQKLTLDLSPMRTMSVRPAELARFLQDGRITLHTPEVRASLGIMRDVATLMTPGFSQLQRDDALFSFLSGNSLMIFAGSWDYAVFLRDGNFDVGVATLPMPSADDPTYGRFVLGPTAEGYYPEAAMGVTRASAHPEVALDFLRFLTSHPTARKFAARTHRVSSIVGVEPPGGSPVLAPRTEGQISGFMIDIPGTFGGGNYHGAFQRNLHALISPQGGVDAFVDAFEQDMSDALKGDLQRYTTVLHRNIQQLDGRLGLLLTQPPETAAQTADWTRTSETQHDMHGDYFRILAPPRK